jgi:tRNA-binding protein
MTATTLLRLKALTFFPHGPLYRPKITARKAGEIDCCATVAKASHLPNLKTGRENVHLVPERSATPADPISFDQFLAVDIRIGDVVSAEALQGARKPAYVLHIDFGPTIGIRKSSAQITENYCVDELVGRQVAAVVNFPPRQIGKIMSEVLTLGFPDEKGAVLLFSPDQRVPTGSRLF